MLEFEEKKDAFYAETLIVKVRIGKTNRSIAIDGVISEAELRQIADKLDELNGKA